MGRRLSIAWRLSARNRQGADRRCPDGHAQLVAGSTSESEGLRMVRLFVIAAFSRAKIPRPLTDHLRFRPQVLPSVTGTGLGAALCTLCDSKVGKTGG